MTNVAKDVKDDDRTCVAAVLPDTLQAVRFTTAEANTTVGRLLKDEAERIVQTAERHYIAKAFA